MKKAILLVAYGASNPQARQSLARFEGLCRARFPGYPIRWAYSSGLVRSRLAERRQKSDSVTKALLRLHYENFTHVAIQPLQTIPGREHEAVLEAASAVSATTGLSCPVGSPLLPASSPILANALACAIPPQVAPNDHVIFMGHGARHPAGAAYATLHATLHALDPRLHVGTMSSIRPLEQILAGIPGGKIWLLPLLSTIGTHALHDMAGSSAKSWSSRIRQQGFECRPILAGMLEYDAICQIWLEHLERAFNDTGTVARAPREQSSIKIEKE